MDVYFHSFGFGGYKVPVRPGDYFTIWADHNQAIELDASVILDMLASRIRDARIVGAIAAQTNPIMRERLGYSEPSKPPAKMLSDKESKRAARKSRKKGTGS